MRTNTAGGVAMRLHRLPATGKLNQCTFFYPKHKLVTAGNLLNTLAAGGINSIYIHTHHLCSNTQHDHSSEPRVFLLSRVSGWPARKRRNCKGGGGRHTGGGSGEGVQLDTECSPGKVW